MEVNNPIYSFEIWYSDQPEEIRQLISYQVMVNISEMNVNELNLDLQECFKDWLNEHALHPSPFKHVGIVLCIRAAIDFFVMRTYGSKDGWEEIIDRNKQISILIDKEGQSTDFIEKMLEGVPFRKRLWIKASESWKSLCYGLLSDTALNDWIDSVSN